MCDVLDRIVEKAKNEATVEHIKNIMDSLSVTAQEAMDILKIPADDRTKYVSKLHMTTQAQSEH